MLHLNSTTERTAQHIKFVASLSRILSNFGFSLVLLNSLRYQWKYVSDVKFDNCYITEYFQKVDTRRYLAGSRKTLLPIRRFEKESLFYPLQFYISVHQKPMLKLTLTIQIFIVVFLLGSLALDYFVHDLFGKLFELALKCLNQ